MREGCTTDDYADADGVNAVKSDWKLRSARGVMTDGDSQSMPAGAISLTGVDIGERLPGEGGDGRQAGLLRQVSRLWSAATDRLPNEKPEKAPAKTGATAGVADCGRAASATSVL